MPREFSLDFKSLIYFGLIHERSGKFVLTPRGERVFARRPNELPEVQRIIYSANEEYRGHRAMLEDILRRKKSPKKVEPKPKVVPAPIASPPRDPRRAEQMAELERILSQGATGKSRAAAKERAKKSPPRKKTPRPH